MVLLLRELIDLVIMTFVVGYIFSDAFQKTTYKSFDIKAILIAAAITAPAIIFHELAHKFAALSYGLDAVFHAAYTWLLFGVVLKLLNTGLIFFVPGFVSVSGISEPLQHSIIAFAGPFLNLVLYGISYYASRLEKTPHKWKIYFIISRKINGFLFLLNMLPIPGFDGFSVYRGLYQTFF